MKNLVLLCAAALLTASVVTAQDKDKTTHTQVVKDEKTVKKTSTVPQKVHNTFSKKKHYNGKKSTHVKETKTETTTK